MQSTIESEISCFFHSLRRRVVIVDVFFWQTFDDFQKTRSETVREKFPWSWWLENCIIRRKYFPKGCRWQSRVCTQPTTTHFRWISRNENLFGKQEHFWRRVESLESHILRCTTHSMCQALNQHLTVKNEFWEFWDWRLLVDLLF